MGETLRGCFLKRREYILKNAFSILHMIFFFLEDAMHTGLSEPHTKLNSQIAFKKKKKKKTSMRQNLTFTREKKNALLEALILGVKSSRIKKHKQICMFIWFYDVVM